MNWLWDRSPFCWVPEYFSPSLQTIDFEVDLDKYAGEWFEQARKPQRFQFGCVESKAIYTLDKSKSKVIVNNECITRDKGLKHAQAFAVPNSEKRDKLKVYFTKWFGGSYWILDLDKDYQWAVVGEPCRRMAWVLSRNEKVPPHEVVKRIDLLKKKGYDVGDIILRGEGDKRPF